MMENNAFEQLKQFKQLKEEGVLTEEEFELKKQQFLSNSDFKNKSICNQLSNKEIDKGSLIFSDEHISIYDNIIEYDSKVQLKQGEIEEEQIYKDVNVKISSTKCIILDHIFFINDIKSTSIKKTESSVLIPTLIIFILTPLLFFIGYEFGSLDLMYFSPITFSIGLSWLLFWIKKKYSLIIHTSNGPTKTITVKSKVYIEELISYIDIAIEKASPKALFNDQSLVFNEPESIAKDEDIFHEKYVKITKNEFKVDETSYNIRYIKSSVSELNKSKIYYSYFLILIGSVLIFISITVESWKYALTAGVMLVYALHLILNKEYLVLLDMGDCKMKKAITSPDKEFANRIDTSLKRVLHQQIKDSPLTEAPSINNQNNSK